jgi:hypothetical protein
MTAAIAGAMDRPKLEDADLRQAMLSVYFRSLGSQLESQGAPVVALPPYARPLPLETALGILAGADEGYLWDAYWRIVRSVPVEGWDDPTMKGRYPPAFVDSFGSVDDLDNRRRGARQGAQLFAAALMACADGRGDDARALADILKASRTRCVDEPRQFDKLAESVLGKPAHQFLVELSHREEKTATELRNLQGKVGINLNDFVEDFADTVVFADIRKEHFAGRERPDDGMTVLTSSCVVRQDTETLTTTATVTALAQTSFEVLTYALDPIGWPKRSSVIVDTAYVDDPFDLASGHKPERLGETFEATAEEPRYLFEEVDVRWGAEDEQTGQFRNVLAIEKFCADKENGIRVPFKLSRSVDSRILWDSRAGGLLIDDGFLDARPIGHDANGEPDRWRVTTRKVLKFSDRTPYSNEPGWPDFGQMLNYLAPASVTWWLETEMNSARSPAYNDDTPPVAEPDRSS